MDLHLRVVGDRDLSKQVYAQLRAAILDGTLPEGSKLPPTRELAARLSISRNTVSVAYEWLTAEGLIRGRVGSGSYVDYRASARARSTPSIAPIRPRDIWAKVAAPRVLARCRYDFGVGSPDPELFPYAEWRRAVARQIRAQSLPPSYGDPAGHPALREALAQYATVARGVRAEPDDVVITSGAQQAFDLISRVLIEPNARVAIEDPGYPPVRQLFASYGARVAPIQVDGEGLVVSALPSDTRLVYVTPSHQFPLGMPMSHERRLQLLAWAESRNAVIVEDDYDSEFRFGGRPLETLHSLHRSGRVIYVGSLSKVMLPTLRLGFLIVPRSLREATIAASYVASWYHGWPEQAALAAFISRGLLARHIRKMRRIYHDRHAEILERISEAPFDKWLAPVPSVTGMHICATLRRSSLRREASLLERAHELDVSFDRLSGFCVTRPFRTGLVLGYGAIASADVEEGLKRLAHCFGK